MFPVTYQLCIRFHCAIKITATLWVIGKKERLTWTPLWLASFQSMSHFLLTSGHFNFVHHHSSVFANQTRNCHWYQDSWCMSFSQTGHIICLKHHICQSFSWEFSLDQNEQHVTKDTLLAGNLVAPLSYLSNLVSPVGDQPCWWLDTPVGGLWPRWSVGEIANLWLQQVSQSGLSSRSAREFFSYCQMRPRCILCTVCTCVVCCTCYTKSTIL